MAEKGSDGPGGRTRRRSASPPAPARAEPEAGGVQSQAHDRRSPAADRRTAGSAPIRFLLLGPMEVRHGTEVLPLAGVKQRAVLAMLLLQPNRVVPVERLVDGLWGERSPASAANTLQSYVSRLRGVLAAAATSGPPPRLRGGPLGYALDVDPTAIDVDEFGKLLDTGRQAVTAGSLDAGAAGLRRALALWRGPALADFAGLPFAAREAPRLEEMRLTALEVLADAELDRGRHADLVADLEQLVAEHPLRERLRGQLMLAMYRCGRQGDALRVYRQTRRILAEELGVDPSPVMQRLHERVLAHDPALDAATPGAPTGLDRSSAAAQDLFVGRTHELRVLASALRDVADGHGRAVLVVGDPGGGKTALVQRFVASAGVDCCWGRCWEDEGAPAFWPWVQVLRRQLGRLPPPGVHSEPPVPAGTLVSDLAELVTTAGLLRPGDLPSEPAQARFRLFEAVADYLTSAGPQPRIIVVEDLHAADTPSLLLLQFLVRQLQDAAVLVLVTLRPPGREPAGRLAGVLAELTREPVTMRLELGPLPADTVRVFLDRAAGRPVPQHVSAAVQRWAEGNPFFLTEMVRLMVTRGQLDRPGDLSEHDLEIPQSIQEMMRRRLVVLSDGALGVLMAAAVAGRRFSIALLERVGAGTSGDVAAAIEAAESAHIVEEVPDGTGDYRFSHSLVRQTLYSWVSGVRRRRLHVLVAEALEATGSATPHPAQLAHHLVAGAAESAAGRAADAAARAAGQAMRQFAHEEAARLYALALDALEGSGAAGGELTAVLLSLGDAQVLSGDVTAARYTFLRVANRARAAGDVTDLAEAALRLGAAFEARAYDPELVGLLQEAIQELPGEHRALRARLLARLAMALYFTAPPAQRAALSDQALRLARASRDPTALAAALNARYFANWGPDYTRERMAAATELRDHAERLGDRAMTLDALGWMSIELLERGDWVEADRLLARHSRSAEEVRHPLHRSYAATWRATRAILDGRFADAELAAHRAFALGQHLAELAVPRFNLQRYLIFREQGRLVELAGDVEMTAARYPQLPGWQIIAATVRVEYGDTAPARAVLAEFAATDRLPLDGNWLFGMAQLAELSAELAEPVAAAALYERLLPYEGRCVVARFAPGCLGGVTRYLGLLAAVREEWAGAEAHLAAAQQLHDRVGADPLSAWTRYDTARLLLTRGHSGDAARAESLLAAAAAAADALGMSRLNQRLAPLRQRLRTGPSPAPPA